jgi:acyl dehydratase
MDEVRFPKPVFHGDTVHVETEVLELRESKSRPQNGIVIFAHRAINQRGEIVASCKRSALMLKKPG